MITGELKSKVDRIWDTMWSGGISNPLSVIEQLTYLLFIKRLDELQTLKEAKANHTGKPIEEPIFYAEHDVADLLEVPDKYLGHVLFRSSRHAQYRTFKIGKRGGTREIRAPHASLKLLQQKLNHVLQLVYRPPATVHGFARGRSIRTNAEQHIGREWVLCADLEDFFPSINFGRVRGALMAPPFRVGSAAAAILARICCARDRNSDGELPQGAPTSGIVSNLICLRLDRQLRQLATANRCTYSRYADDLALSTDRADFPAALAAQDAPGSAGVRMGPALEHVVTSNGFQPNHTKTRLQPKARRQVVAGVVVNEFPNVRSEFLRELRAMVHSWQTHGLAKAGGSNPPMSSAIGETRPTPNFEA